MRDVGPSRRRLTHLADVAQRDFLNGWLMDNQTAFIEVMDLIKEGAPDKFAKLYLEAAKIGMVKEQNINVSFVDRQRDREQLQALVKTRVSPVLPDSYTPYEEVRPKTEEEPIEIKLKEEEEG